MRKPTLWSLVVPKLAGIIEVWVHDSSLFGGLSILQHSQEQQVRKTTYLLARTRNYPAIRLSRSRVDLLQLSSTFPSSDFISSPHHPMPSRICTYLACSGVHITVSIGWFRFHMLLCLSGDTQCSVDRVSSSVEDMMPAKHPGAYHRTPGTKRRSWARKSTRSRFQVDGWNI
jgi:hypothetical protein